LLDSYIRYHAIFVLGVIHIYELVLSRCQQVSAVVQVYGWVTCTEWWVYYQCHL